MYIDSATSSIREEIRRWDQSAAFLLDPRVGRKQRMGRCGERQRFGQVNRNGEIAGIRELAGWPIKYLEIVIFVSKVSCKIAKPEFGLSLKPKRGCRAVATRQRHTWLPAPALSRGWKSRKERFVFHLRLSLVRHKADRERDRWALWGGYIVLDAYYVRIASPEFGSFCVWRRHATAKYHNDLQAIRIIPITRYLQIKRP